MAIWIQSLSWALIYSLAQGFSVFALLWLLLKVVPIRMANVRYHLSLSALTILLAWFVTTWWQQFQSLTIVKERVLDAQASGVTIIWLQSPNVVTENLSNFRLDQSLLNTLFPWLFTFYIAGLLLTLVRLSAGMLQLFSLKNTATFQPDSTLLDLLNKQKSRLLISSPVKLLISTKAHVPMVIGFLKPVILMPLAVIGQLDQKQLETIILHELAHIKRHDYLVNILQTIAETILFFNPFVWLISSITRREREYSCDDLVVNLTSEPVCYTTALAALATRRTGNVVIAATGQPNHLFNRIKRIMEMKKSQFSYSRMVAAIIIITVVTGSVMWVKPALSRVKKDKPVTAVPPTPPVPPAITAVPVVKPGSAADTTAVQLPAIPEAPIPPQHAAIENKPVEPTPPQKPIEPRAPIANMPEENQLVQRLLQDRLVDQVNGFVVEKRENRLYINGQMQADGIANKYLSGLTKEKIRVQVFPLSDRMRMHPDASFIQLILPCTFSSPCVETRPEKEGC